MMNDILIDKEVDILSSLIVVGSQWGDEGKGKIIDFLAEKADVVVRYSGGNNAGHTVVVGDEEYKLHLIPSGILYGGKPCVISAGVVIDPQVLLSEIEYLNEKGISTDNLRIDERAHIIFPYHKSLDALEEEKRGNEKIGTTKRGIGPCYRDKTERTGIRVCDMLSDTFRAKLERNVSAQNKTIRSVYDTDGFDFDEIYEAYTGYAKQMEKYVADTSVTVFNAIKEDKKVLFEGAQGTLLDLDYGTYPYVTSSNPVAGGVCTGAGIGPTMINDVVGVVKAYTTRVGKGPFPTELFDEYGERLRTVGHEFGTTTGRSRRCGWFDAVIVKYAVRINGLTSMALTKLDVMSGFEKIRICIGYEKDGSIISDFPSSIEELSKCKPVYEEVDGWNEDITGVESFEDLPQNAKAYVERLEELCGVRASIVAIGPKRSQTIVRTQLY